MYLKSLTLKGFKSFADRAHMTFEPGLTVIVGPNGSGKSNVSDAILWVLGEQSAKQLRGQAMEDVIFSGSSARKPVGVAEVTLVLDNSDHTPPVDFNEVAITRRMYRSGRERVPHQLQPVPTHGHPRHPDQTQAWARTRTPSSPRASSTPFAVSRGAPQPHRGGRGHLQQAAQGARPAQDQEYGRAPHARP